MTTLKKTVLAVRYHLGVDLGQRQDHTAMAIVKDVVMTGGAKDAVTFEPLVERRKTVVRVERVALGTGYGKVVDSIRRMVESVALRDCEMVVAVDATGVGAPVVEALRERLYEASERRAWLSLAPVVFTSGQAGHWKNTDYYAPKNELMEGLAMALERRELKLIEGGRFVEELKTELMGMRREMGAAKTRWISAGEHDDLVMATALAWWACGYRPLPGRWRDLPGR